MEIPNKYILIPLFLLSILTQIYAQPSWLKNRRLILNIHRGFVLKNKTETAHLSDQHPTGIELELNRQTKGEKEWHSWYNYPEAGISLQYWIMDPHKRLGNMLGVVFYMHKHVLRTRKFAIMYRISIGPGYVEKRFNLYTNNENNLISSRLNYVLNGRFIFKYRINSKLSLNTGIGIVHFSNGGMRMPNQGINIPSIYAGISWHFPEDVQKNYPRPPKFKRKTTFMMEIAGGSKNDYPVGSPNFPVAVIGLRAGRILNYKSIITLGPDFFYDGSLELLKDTLNLKGRQDYFKGGIAFGHELLLGKFSMVTQIGYLFYDPARILSPVYQRYGLKFYINPHISATVAMKSHLGRADFVEWSLGYRIDR